MPMFTDPVTIALVNKAKAAVEQVDDIRRDFGDEEAIAYLSRRITELVDIVEAPW